MGNACDGLRPSPSRSKMCATVCNLLPGDCKCARWFASFSQEIANARDGLRASPRRSKSIPFIFKKILRTQFFADRVTLRGHGSDTSSYDLFEQPFGLLFE